MNRLLLAATLSLLLGSPACAATRNFSIESFDRVRIEGGYRVTLTTGVPPFASASGGAAALDGVSIDVQGRTLVVRADRAAWGGYPGEQRGPVDIVVGTHELSAATINGSGSLAISAVEGLLFDLSVQGAGSASIATVNVDQLRLGLSGATSATLSGNVGKLTATVRGTSALDGASLNVKSATLGVEGPAIVKLAISDTAKVDAAGAATINLTGGPSCTLRVSGSATVEGCH